MSFALGVYVFVAGLFVAGLFGLLGPVFWFMWPFLMLLAGVKPIYELIKRDGARFRKWFQTRRTPLWSYPVLAFGFIGIGMVYFAILTPENASYDARWYHLPIAERYAITGQIRRFPEGWMAGTTPHLASLIYTWAFLVPKSNIFHRVPLYPILFYQLRDLTVPAGSQPKQMYGAPRVPEGTGNTNTPEALIEQAGFVVFEACHTPLPPIDSVFEHAVSRNTAELWIRNAEPNSDGHRTLRTDDNM